MSAIAIEQPRPSNLPADRGGTRTVRPVVVDAARLAMAVEAGVFDADEAAAFLRFPSVLCFKRARQRHGVKGVKLGRAYRYSRETLEALRKLVFGLDVPAGRKGGIK